MVGKGPRYCALLLKHMYGTRKTGDGWHEEISDTLMSKLGFSKGDASACIFRHPEKEIECSMHGDDLAAAGPKDALDWYKAELQKHYELDERARLGPGPEDTKESKMLNRVVRWTGSLCHSVSILEVHVFSFDPIVGRCSFPRVFGDRLQQRCRRRRRQICKLTR